MRLHEVVIRNFKCITELSVTIPQTVAQRAGSADFLTILGRNNIGKSSILEAIRLALPGSDISKPSIDHYREKNVENGPIFNIINAIHANPGKSAADLVFKCDVTIRTLYRDFDDLSLFACSRMKTEGPDINLWGSSSFIH